MNPVIIIVITVVLFLVPINSFGEIQKNDNQFMVNLILVSMDCSYSIHGMEFQGLMDIAHRYLESFQFHTEMRGYCVTPDQFFDVWEFLAFTNEEIIVVMYNLDDGLWTENSYRVFGYDPPEDLSITAGEVFFEYKMILMGYSLKDDFNSPVLTHELMHFVLWNDGATPDVYINQVHEDWAVYKDEYKKKEKLFSDVANKYYYIFG